MIIGKRLLDRIEEQGLTQAEVGRRVGISQQAIGRLVGDDVYNSRYLHKIARVLKTSPEYLTGEIDDPDIDAPLAVDPPSEQFVTVQMAVVLPPVQALEKMFRGMLRTINPEDPPVEFAGPLAELLPIALSRLIDLRLDSGTRLVRSEATATPDSAVATAHHVSR